MMTLLTIIGAGMFGCCAGALVLGMCRAAADDQPTDERIRDAMRR
jgi:hypothetical protein